MLSHEALHYVGSAAYAASHVDGIDRSLATFAAVARVRAAGHRRRLFTASPATFPCSCAGSIPKRS